MASAVLIIVSIIAVSVFGASAQANKTAQPQCGISIPSGVQKRVVSGTTALPGAWPWQAVLLLGRRKIFVCSGALIHPSWVLTAAHCIQFKSPRFYHIRLGEFDRSRYEGREQTIGVKQIIVHPHHDYPTRRNNDLALIKLQRLATINQWVSTVCLPTTKDYLHGKLRCYATGWGLTRRTDTYSRRLQQAHVPLVTKYRCRQRANPYLRLGYRLAPTLVTNEMLCGGDDTNGAGTCMGDSGGPYVCRNPEGYWVLQGITSWGSKRCLVSERYSVFAKVRVFTRWIESVMNGTEESDSSSKSSSNTTTWSYLRWLWHAMLREKTLWRD